MGIKEMRAKALKKTREAVSREKFKRDRVVVQAIETIDELDEIFNLMMERVRNWYALHYPELEKLVKNPETYLDIIITLKGRDDMGAKNLEKYMRPDQAKKIEQIATQSMGAKLDAKDLDRVAKYASLAMHAKKEREELAAYVDETVKEIAPNMHSIAGGMLTARLIAQAGSLERLSEFPSSTVQVLGAEKALFAHIKKGVAPPKHGLIFQYPAVMQAKQKKRGRMARLVASKLSIASKMDYFGHGLDKSLKVVLDAKVAGAQK